jgi:hypothetical protein
MRGETSIRVVLINASLGAVFVNDMNDDDLSLFFIFRLRDAVCGLFFTLDLRTRVAPRRRVLHSPSRSRTLDFRRLRSTRSM